MSKGCFSENLPVKKWRAGEIEIVTWEQGEITADTSSHPILFVSITYLLLQICSL